jgi:recombinational DNA repair ATPase RecF
MKIGSLHLENYRCFENFDIDFDDCLTVLVGINGAGKTALLDALSFFLSHAGHPNNRQELLYSMLSSDAAINHNSENVIYNIKLSWPGDENNPQHELDFIFERQTKIPMQLRRNNIAIQEQQPKWLQFIQNLNMENPLFVAYMAGRFVSSDAQNQINPSAPIFLTAAFDNAFKSKIDYPSN